MVLGGETLNGPRYIWWNFVASSKEKIEAAKEAWAQATGRMAGSGCRRGTTRSSSRCPIKACRAKVGIGFARPGHAHRDGWSGSREREGSRHASDAVSRCRARGISAKKKQRACDQCKPALRFGVPRA
jgi:hypothetical protein